MNRINLRWIIPLALCLAAVPALLIIRPSGERPFRHLTAGEVKSMTVQCFPKGDPAVEITDPETISQAVSIIKDLVIYGRDEEEYAGGAVVLTLYEADGATKTIAASSPTLRIDGIQYAAKYGPCAKLHSFGREIVQNP